MYCGLVRTLSEFEVRFPVFLMQLFDLPFRKVSYTVGTGVSSILSFVCNSCDLVAFDFFVVFQVQSWFRDKQIVVGAKVASPPKGAVISKAAVIKKREKGSSGRYNDCSY